MITSQVFNVFSAAVDGRLINVRNRHESLRKLSQALQRRTQSFREALLRIDASHDVTLDLALAATLRCLALHAATLDQPRAVKEKLALGEAKHPFTHSVTDPMGVIAIELPQSMRDLAFPLDAIFGPIAAAVTSGNCIVLLHNAQGEEDKALIALVQECLKESLDRETFLCANGATIKGQDLFRPHATVRYVSQAEEKQLHDAERNTLLVSAKTHNVAIIDHSLVDASIYREQNSRALPREKRRLEAIVEELLTFQGNIAEVLVTETIFSIVQQLWRARVRAGQETKIRSVSSTQDTIYAVQRHYEAVSPRALNLVIFALPSTGAYYAQQIKCQSVVLNAVPAELAVSYLPNPSSAELSKSSDGASLLLAPTWSPSMFTAARTTVLVRREPKLKKTHTRPLTESLLIKPMPRRHPDDADFFPTGFKITFFPLAFTLLGAIGFGTFKAGLMGYRFVMTKA